MGKVYQCKVDDDVSESIRCLGTIFQMSQGELFQKAAGDTTTELQDHLMEKLSIKN